jgi:pimeloyl-ACP methyl ester carboxylesterase
MSDLTPMPRALLVIGIVAALAAAYVAIGFFAQRGLMYPAPKGSRRAMPADCERVELAGTDGPVEAWFLPPVGGGAAPAPLLLFTHGNAELIDDWADLFFAPRAAGYAVLLVEYPGYGRSAGSPSEASIGAAVLAAYDWARASSRVDPARIIPYGRSLGGGAACIVAAHRPVAALILESSFTSIRPFAKQFLLPGFLVRDPFDNIAALRSYRGPLLVLHGADDQIIPIAHGRALAASVRGAEFIVMPCGHNNCQRAWDQVLHFLTFSHPGEPSHI